MPTTNALDSCHRADWTHDDVSAPPQMHGNMIEQIGSAVANERYQAFAAGTHAQDACDNFDDPNHDYDRCVRAAVANPVLFLQQGADADQVNVDDVQQAMVGDCYLLAPLAALLPGHYAPA